MTIEIRQSVVPKSSQRWEWKVWLEGSEAELDKVESVEYQLHATFHNPIRTVSDRASKFALSAVALGEFNIHATVHCRDGESCTLEHWLRLGANAPAKEEAPRGIKGDAPAVFISAGSEDAVFAGELKQALVDRGVRVLSPQDVPTGADLESELQSMIDRADFGVAVVSRDTSPWVQKDVERMRSVRIPVIPLMHDVDEPPEAMRDLKGVRVAADADLGEGAEQIVQLARLLAEG